MTIFPREMKNYELIDADRGTLGIKSGGEWSRGLTVKREQKRTAVLIYIKEVKS